MNGVVGGPPGPLSVEMETLQAAAGCQKLKIHAIGAIGIRGAGAGLLACPSAPATLQATSRQHGERLLVLPTSHSMTSLAQVPLWKTLSGMIGDPWRPGEQSIFAFFHTTPIPAAFNEPSLAL